jgi:hypothetical protein
MDEIEPLPCPFCGGTDLSTDWMKEAAFICCETCKMIGPDAEHHQGFRYEDGGSFDQGQLRVIAVAAWNRRVTPAGSD